MARKKKARRGGRRPGTWEHVQPEEIRAFRDRTGLSRAKLAAQVGVSATSIQNWEAGQAPSRRAQRLLRGVLDGDVPEDLEETEDSSDGSVARATGDIVSAYLQAVRGPLPPEQLVEVVRNVRRALQG